MHVFYQVNNNFHNVIIINCQLIYSNCEIRSRCENFRSPVGDVSSWSFSASKGGKDQARFSWIPNPSRKGILQTRISFSSPSAQIIGRFYAFYGKGKIVIFSLKNEKFFRLQRFISFAGFAGIVLEKILKDSDVSLFVRNVQLSIVSLPVGLANVFVSFCFYVF